MPFYDELGEPVFGEAVAGKWFIESLSKVMARYGGGAVQLTGGTMRSTSGI